MPSDYDATEFVDGDLQAHKAPALRAGQPQRAPTREELGSKAAETQQKLAAILREKEELERERATLEETRRRQAEFQTGRQEMIHNLTRGLGLLEEAEFNARHDAEQMGKAITDLRDALNKIETIHEESWVAPSFDVELTRALTVLENARMEWNTARLKFPVLAARPQSDSASGPTEAAPGASLFAPQNSAQLCRVGLALTWPVAAMAVVIAGLLLVLLLRR